MILDTTKYAVSKLKTVEELIGSNQLSRLRLSEIVCQKTAPSDYYQFRFRQLITKYLKLPNPHSFGSERPMIDFGEVAYLNLDICQFTSFCSAHSVQQILQFLSSLFNKFDERIRMTKNLIQVKISGDSYELMSLPTLIKRYSQSPNLKPAQLQLLQKHEAVVQLVSVGLGFVQDCRDVLQTFPLWRDVVGLRVGVSFGRVTGSLLGNKICRFDTFGRIPAEAEEVQTRAERNTIMLHANVQRILAECQELLKDYIVDHVTTQSLRGNVVNYQQEIAEFACVGGCVEKGITGVK